MLTLIVTGFGRGQSGANDTYSGLDGPDTGSKTANAGMGRGHPGPNMTHTGLGSIKRGTKHTKAGNDPVKTDNETCNTGTAYLYPNPTTTKLVDLDRTPGALRTDLGSKGKKRMIADEEEDEEESDGTDDDATISDASSTGSADAAFALKRRTQTYASMAQSAARRAKKQKTAAETDDTHGPESLREYFAREFGAGGVTGTAAASPGGTPATRTHESTGAAAALPHPPPPPSPSAAPPSPAAAAPAAPPAKPVQTKANSHKFALHDPARAGCECCLCGLRFTRRETLRYTHFNGCARRRGNPRGLPWDAHPSCWLRGAQGPSGRGTGARGHDAVAAADPDLPAPKVSKDPQPQGTSPSATDASLTASAQKQPNRWDQHAARVRARQAAAVRGSQGTTAGRASRGLAPPVRTGLGQSSFGARQPAALKRPAGDAAAEAAPPRKRARTTPSPRGSEPEPEPASPADREVVDLTAEAAEDPASSRASGDSSEADSRGWWEVSQCSGYLGKYGSEDDDDESGSSGEDSDEEEEEDEEAERVSSARPRLVPGHSANVPRTQAAYLERKRRGAAVVERWLDAQLALAFAADAGPLPPSEPRNAALARRADGRALPPGPVPGFLEIRGACPAAGAADLAALREYTWAILVAAEAARRRAAAPGARAEAPIVLSDGSEGDEEGEEEEKAEVVVGEVVDDEDVLPSIETADGAAVTGTAEDPIVLGSGSEGEGDEE